MVRFIIAVISHFSCRDFFYSYLSYIPPHLIPDHPHITLQLVSSSDIFIAHQLQFSYPYTDRCGKIRWRLVNLPAAKSQRNVTLSLTQQQPTVNRSSEVGLFNFFPPTHSGILIDFPFSESLFSLLWHNTRYKLFKRRRMSPHTYAKQYSPFIMAGKALW